MNKEERVKLVFETISKIAGFEIKPDKEFYMVVNGTKTIYKIDESLNLRCKNPGNFGLSAYNILAILKGGYQLEEIKEPLVTEKERDFLKHFNFEELSKEDLSKSTLLYMFNENNVFVTIINKSNLGFDGLKEGKKYSGKELGL